jgi:hypothetical protein
MKLSKRVAEVKIMPEAAVEVEAIRNCATSVGMLP